MLHTIYIEYRKSRLPFLMSLLVFAFFRPSSHLIFPPLGNEGSELASLLGIAMVWIFQQIQGLMLASLHFSGEDGFFQARIRNLPEDRLLKVLSLYAHAFLHILGIALISLAVFSLASFQRYGYDVFQWISYYETGQKVKLTVWTLSLTGVLSAAAILGYTRLKYLDKIILSACAFLSCIGLSFFLAPMQSLGLYRVHEGATGEFFVFYILLGLFAYAFCSVIMIFLQNRLQAILFSGVIFILFEFVFFGNFGSGFKPYWLVTIPTLPLLVFIAFYLREKNFKAALTSGVTWSFSSLSLLGLVFAICSFGGIRKNLQSVHEQYFTDHSNGRVIRVSSHDAANQLLYPFSKKHFQKSRTYSNSQAYLRKDAYYLDFKTRMGWFDQGLELQIRHTKKGLVLSEYLPLVKRVSNLLGVATKANHYDLKFTRKLSPEEAQSLYTLQAFDPVSGKVFLKNEAGTSFTISPKEGLKEDEEHFYHFLNADFQNLQDFPYYFSYDKQSGTEYLHHEENVTPLPLRKEGSLAEYGSGSSDGWYVEGKELCVSILGNGATETPCYSLDSNPVAVKKRIIEEFHTDKKISVPVPKKGRHLVEMDYLEGPVKMGRIYKENYDGAKNLLADFKLDISENGQVQLSYGKNGKTVLTPRSRLKFSAFGKWEAFASQSEVLITQWVVFAPQSMQSPGELLLRYTPEKDKLTAYLSLFGGPGRVRFYLIDPEGRLIRVREETASTPPSVDIRDMTMYTLTKKGENK